MGFIGGGRGNPAGHCTFIVPAIHILDFIIEDGKLADIIAVAGNPLDDIRLLEDVKFVMKGGEVVKSP